MTTWRSTYDSWTILIFLLIFFGGVIVLFLYISTLAINEQTKVKTRVIALIPIVLLFRRRAGAKGLIEGGGLIGWEVFKHLRSGWGPILIVYLLYCLILVVKTCKSYLGALRSRYLWLPLKALHWHCRVNLHFKDKGQTTKFLFCYNPLRFFLFIRLSF